MVDAVRRCCLNANLFGVMSLWESGQSLFTCIARFCSVLLGFAFVPSFIWFCLVVPPFFDFPKFWFFSIYRLQS